jgi:CDP-diacylglycerol--glycerol-3-phosphate 3-phosphatidyltransferase
MLKHLPNALTLLRLVLAPVVAWAVWRAADGGDRAWAIAAFCLFVVAALTDLFDGMAARAFNAGSKFGRIIDPIADKALVGLPLIALSLAMYGLHWVAWPLLVAATVVIVCRDALMTWVRLTAPDGEGAPVSQLAKTKTALELIAVGLAPLMILGFEMVKPGHDNDWTGVSPVTLAISVLFLLTLIAAAALSAFTAFRYLTAK